MEKKHFSHDHPLLEVECTAELCAGCRSDINGLAFGCKACSFYLHKLCANLPRDLSDPIRIGRFDRVELQFFPSGPGDDYFYCGECEHEGHEQGFAYVRYSCENFFLNGYGDENSDQVKKVDKLHVDCALLKQPYHKHSLAYINERKLFFAECAECGTKFQENEYEGSNLCGCEECGDAFHKKCLDLPEHVETEGTDPSKLNDFLDSVLWDYNDWDHYFCKGCNEEKVDPTNERLQHFSHRHPLVELEYAVEIQGVASRRILASSKRQEATYAEVANKEQKSDYARKPLEVACSSSSIAANCCPSSSAAMKDGRIQTAMIAQNQKEDEDRMEVGTIRNDDPTGDSVTGRFSEKI
ncbi:hypothetical protein Ancab_021700 [Ancistrocladus abbreviatus]